MYERSPDSLVFDLGASRALAGALSVLHLGALVLSSILPIALPMRLALTVAIALSFYRALRRHALRRSCDAVVALALGDDDECALRHGDSAEWKQGRLISRWVHPAAAMVVVRGDGRRPASAVVIPADALATEAFRRLRVRLRLRTASAPEPYRAAHSASRKKGSRA